MEKDKSDNTTEWEKTMLIEICLMYLITSRNAQCNTIG